MQTIRFLAALFILLMLFWGCGGQNSDANEAPHSKIEGTADVVTAKTEPVSASREAPAADKKLASTSLILTVNADPVRWPEFHFWLKYIGKYYKSTLGIEEITDWSVQQNGMDLEDFFLATAVGYASKDRAIEAKAKELGIELSRQDLATIEETRAKNIQIYGSVSEYLRIVASMYMSEEVFNYLTKIDYLGNYIFEHFYGKNGERFTDREVSSYIEEGGFICARYIFRSGLDADGNPLTDEKEAENTRLLKELLERLSSSDNPGTLFTELANTYGEDETMPRFPNGRLFSPGSKGTSFETACSELKENEYSDIVTTKEGSYIILRMPISPAMTVDSAGNTLRYRAAYERFKQKVETWATEMNVVYEEGYYQVDVEGIL